MIYFHKQLIKLVVEEEKKKWNFKKGKNQNQTPPKKKTDLNIFTLTFWSKYRVW